MDTQLPRGEFASKALSHSYIVFARDMMEVVFLGPWRLESVGDYASGRNHVLPIYGYAWMYGGVSLDSFLKYMTVQSLTEEGLKKLGPYVATMAEVEGLEVHNRAVTLRLQDIEARQVANIS